MGAPHMRRTTVLTYGLIAVGIAVSAQQAQAESINLLCGKANGSDAFYVSIDTDASTAKEWTSPTTSDQVPAYPETITAQSVTWTVSEPGLPSSYSSLDRGTGEFIKTGGDGRKYSSVCKRAAAVF